MGGGKPLRCLAPVEDIDDEEDDKQREGTQRTDVARAGEVGLLTGYLCLLLVGVVDGGQLGHGGGLLVGDSRVEHVEDAHGSHHGRVAAAGFDIGAILGQHVELDIV